MAKILNMITLNKGKKPAHAPLRRMTLKRNNKKQEELVKK